MTIKELQARLEKLEAGRSSGVVMFTMGDGKMRGMKASRLIEACSEAIAGSRNVDVQTLLQSVGNNASNKLVDLLKMCITN